MLFQHSITACLFAICSSSNAATLAQKRDTLANITIFAYGAATPGLPVFYADGLAYIGRTPPTFATMATNITFATDSTSTTVPWTIAANSTTQSFNETLDLYIVTTADSFTQVGFASSDTLPTDANTTGFTWFGSSVAFAASDSNFELQFWANATTEEGIYGLYWNTATTAAAAADGTVMDGSFPVTLKSTPPTILGP